MFLVDSELIKRRIKEKLFNLYDNTGYFFRKTFFKYQNVVQLLILYSIVTLYTAQCIRRLYSISLFSWKNKTYFWLIWFEFVTFSLEAFLGWIFPFSILHSELFTKNLDSSFSLTLNSLKSGTSFSIVFWSYKLLYKINTSSHQLWMAGGKRRENL